MSDAEEQDEVSAAMRRRITRPCYGCGGKRTCWWHTDAWVCSQCGDEWYPDHGGVYLAPEPD